MGRFLCWIGWHDWAWHRVGGWDLLYCRRCKRKAGDTMTQGDRFLITMHLLRLPTQLLRATKDTNATQARVDEHLWAKGLTPRPIKTYGARANTSTT